MPDVNVLVNANRPSSPHHIEAKGWLERSLVAEEPLGLWEVTLVSAYRILTDPRIWTVPETPESALGYLDSVRAAPATIALRPGERFWTIFAGLVREVDVRGPLTSDAMLAALAIEHRCRIATFDADFAKFKGVATLRPMP